MKLDHPPARRSARVVSPALLITCFGVSLGSAYLLIPKGDELYHMLLADGEQERVMQLVVQDKLPVPAAALVLPQPAEPAPVDYRRLMRIAFDSVGGGELSAREVERISSVLEHCDPTAESFVHLKRHAGKIGSRENERFFDILARRAVAEGDPHLAAEIYSELGRRVERPSVATVEMMVQCYRWTGQGRPAFECIERLRSRLGGTDALPAALRDTYVALLMEVDRAGEAFEILRADFERAGGEPGRLAALLPTLVEAASYSERGDELAPCYERYFASVPEAGMSLAQLAAIGRGELGSGQVSFLDHAKRYAQICEWNDLYDRSFEFYLKCAALGDGFSLARATALNEGLMRHRELGELLVEVVPVPGHPEHSLRLARLLGEEGRYDEAAEAYALFLQSDPRSFEALVERAALEAERGDLEAALAGFEEAAALRADDHSLRGRIAGLHVALGDPAAAFEIYRSLPESAHDEGSLENLIMLAEAHGDYQELRRATQLRFTRLERPTVDDFLDLAQCHSLAGDTGSELATLTGALHKLESSEKLAVALADVLYRESRFEEAMSLLTRRDLRDNAHAMSLFIEICGGTDNHAYASKYLPEGIEDRFTFTPSVRIELGQVYEETGRLDRAQSLYASVPEGGMAWQLLATAKYKTGEFDRAEEYQRRYLKAAAHPDAQDWVFLGDICKNLGKEREATEAYRHSLNLLKAELRPRSASL